jgi:hypothetical protein
VTKWKEYQKQAEPGTTFFLKTLLCILDQGFVCPKNNLFLDFCPRLGGEDVPCEEPLHSCTLKVTERWNEHNELAATFFCCSPVFGCPSKLSRSLVSNGPTLELESSTFFESRKIKSTLIQAYVVEVKHGLQPLHLFIFKFFWVGY